MTPNTPRIIRNRDIDGAPTDTRFGPHHRSDGADVVLASFPWAVVVEPGQTVSDAAITKMVSVTQNLYPDARQISISRDYEGFATIDAVTGDSGTAIWLDGDGTNDIYQNVAHDAGDMTDLEIGERRLVTIPELRAPVAEHIQQISDDAGYGAIMPAILSIVRDRENVSETSLRALTSDDIQNWYYASVDNRIDDMVGSIRWFDGSDDDYEGDAEDEEDVEDVRPHIASICQEAGLGVMAPVFDVIIDRDEVSDGELLALDEDDVTRFYELFIARAVDRLEDDLCANDQKDPAVKKFLSDAVTQRAAANTSARLSWGEMLDALDELPDATLAENSGSQDTTGTRDRLNAVIGSHPAGEPVYV